MTCDECGATGGHKLGCSILEAKVRESMGANATVDGEEARIDPGVPLVEIPPATDDDVLANLARCVEKEAAARTIANSAKNALAAAHKQTVAAYEYAATHYSKTRQIEMVLTVGGTEPEDGEGE